MAKLKRVRRIVKKVKISKRALGGASLLSRTKGRALAQYSLTRAEQIHRRRQKRARKASRRVVDNIFGI